MYKLLYDNEDEVMLVVFYDDSKIIDVKYKLVVVY